MIFKVNNLTWYLVEVNPLDDILRRSDGSYTVGVTDNNTKCVYISKALYGAFKERVIMHELVHVASFSYNCHIPIETEEIIADFFSLYGREIINIMDDILSNLFKRMA